MNTSLSHLPPDKQQSIQAIIRLVLKEVNPEKIILFGFYAESVNDPAWQLYSEYSSGIIYKPVKNRTNGKA